MHILFLPITVLNFVRIKKSQCVTCSRILPVSVCCVLQGSGVTALKCGDINDMNFVANSMEITTMKFFFENRSTFVKPMNECIVAQFLLRHGAFIHNVFNYAVVTYESRHPLFDRLCTSLYLSID